MLNPFRRWNDISKFWIIQILRVKYIHSLCILFSIVFFLYQGIYWLANENRIHGVTVWLCQGKKSILNNLTSFEIFLRSHWPKQNQKYTENHLENDTFFHMMNNFGLHKSFKRVLFYAVVYQHSRNIHEWAIFLSTVQSTRNVLCQRNSILVYLPITTASIAIISIIFILLLSNINPYEKLIHRNKAISM